MSGHHLYSPPENADHAFTDDPRRPSIGSSGDHVGVALPDDVQPGALYSPGGAIRLGLELVRLGELLEIHAESIRAEALDDYAEPYRRLNGERAELRRWIYDALREGGADLSDDADESEPWMRDDFEAEQIVELVRELRAEVDGA